MTFGKILHVGNILNNGYLNCKFLRRAHIEADSITIDYRHVQAQPEWEEVAISSSDLDHFNPDWSKIDLKGYIRPDWFFDIPIADIDRLVSPPKIESIQSNETPPPKPQQVIASNPYYTKFKSLTRRVLRKAAHVSGLIHIWRKAKAQQLKKNNEKIIEESPQDEYFQQLINEYKSFYPDKKPLSLNDITEWYPRSLAQKNLFEKYPLIQAYSLDPIYVMLSCPRKPFIAFEHGTLRDFPFEDSARGRLYALAVQKAEKVIITNADCNIAAKKLGLTNYLHIPHPVDETLYHPKINLPLREELQSKYNADWIFVAPARHHWKHCPEGMETSWLKRNNLIIEAFATLTQERPDIKYVLVFFEWGQEVDLSKELIKNLSIENHVVWKPISSKPIIKEYYNASHIVLDQFNDGIGTFGTVVPEALACGKPVLINFKRELHDWCFKESPPLLNCTTSKEIFNNIVKLIDDKDYYSDICESSRKWFINNHSSEVVIKEHIQIYSEINKKYNWDWC